MITWRFHWEPRDLWIGMFWDYKPLAYDDGKGVKFDASGDQAFLQMAASLGVASSPPRPRLDLWICLLPCLPLHVTWWGEWAKSPENASWSNLVGEKGILSEKEFRATEEDMLLQILGTPGRRLKIWPAHEPEPPPESIARFVAKAVKAEGPFDFPQTDVKGARTLMGPLDGEPWVVTINNVLYRLEPSVGHQLWLCGDVWIHTDAWSIAEDRKA